METKCLICGKKNKKTFLNITEWIIDPPKDAMIGKKHSVHSSCLSDKLYVENPEGFVYGRLSLYKPKPKPKSKSKKEK